MEVTRALRVAGIAALLTSVVVGAIRLFVVASASSSGLSTGLAIEFAAWSLVFWVGVGLLIAATVVGRGSKRGADLYQLVSQNPLTHYQVSPTQRTAEAWGLQWGGTYALVVGADQLELLAPGRDGSPSTFVAELPLAQVVRVTTVDVSTAGHMRLAVSINVTERATLELFVAKGRSWWFAPASSVEKLASQLSKVVGEG